MEIQKSPRSPKKKIIMIGCFDTKAEDYSYLYSNLVEFGASIMAINVGVLGSTDSFPIDVEARQVAEAANISFEALKTSKDRSFVIDEMGQGAAHIIAKLISKGQIAGAISMGGGGGTFMALKAMQAIPIGIPKLCLSTVASKDLSRQVGTKDITLMSSVVDVAGLNNISRILIRQAAGAICGMVNASTLKIKPALGTIAISMFGNTTKCVEFCTALLKKKGYEVLAFHATGVGGRTMENLITEGLIDGVLDITITELADELCNGICSAGEDRLTAAGKTGIPQVVVPGCLDMVNFGHPDTIPLEYKSRLLYSWAPDVTLMRTNEEENVQLGNEISQKLYKSNGEVLVLLPLQGISIVSSEGGIFYKPDIDRILFDTIKLKAQNFKVKEVNANINDEQFAEVAVAELLNLMS